MVWYWIYFITLDDIVMLATAQHKYYHCKKIGCIAINNT